MSDGDTILHYACRRGNVAKITNILDSGAKIDCVNYAQVTPLMRAAQYGKLDIVKLLEKRGSNFRAVDDYGDSVLHYACMSDNIALVTHLLDSGLQIDCVNYKDETPLMRAAKTGKLDIVKLLEARGSNFTAHDKNGDSVLHFACRSDNVALVTHLLDSGLQIDCMNNEQETPLMRAAKSGKLNILKLLQIRGSNFKARNKYGDNVLHYGCMSDNVALVTHLLDSKLHIDCVNYEQETALMRAAWNGNVNIVKLLEARGISLKALDKYGDSVLHYACRSDNVALVTHLLDSGLKIGCVNYSQMTSVMRAAEYGKLYIVQFLRRGSSNFRDTDKYGNTVLHYACRSDNVTLVTYLLDLGLQINCVNYEQVTPLLTAAKCGKLDTVKLLQARGSSFKALDKDGDSVLHYACRSDNVRLVTHLLDSGLQIDCVNCEQVTPLLTAAEYGKLNIVKLLQTRGSNLKTVDRNSDSALHYACRSDNVELVTYLLDSGLQIDSVNNKQVTPLMIAAQSDNSYVKKKGNNFTALNNYGDSVLHYACRSDSVTLVSHLLDSGLQIDRVNYRQVTPLMYAAEYGKLDIVKFLKTKGSKLTALDEDGDSVLHYACMSDNVALVTHLLDSGLQIDCVNYGHVTPLMKAAEYGKLDIIKLLTLRGSKLDGRDYLGRSPLWMASHEGHLKVVRFLYEQGADLCAQSKVTGWTPLHVAALNGHLNVVEYLVEKGVSLEVKDNRKRTPFDVAVEINRIDISEFLKLKMKM